jgi:hypothetical protein
MEVTRRCGWLSKERVGPERVVWARRGVALTECPRSYVSAESDAWIEGHAMRQLLGGLPIEKLPARDVHALALVEAERRREESNGGDS